MSQLHCLTNLNRHRGERHDSPHLTVVMVQVFSSSGLQQPLSATIVKNNSLSSCLWFIFCHYDNHGVHGLPWPRMFDAFNRISHWGSIFLSSTVAFLGLTAKLIVPNLSNSGIMQFLLQSSGGSTGSSKKLSKV